ncbi:MAG: hypothetical protein ABR592_04100 [Nitriliruptorales bacterium]
MGDMGAEERDERVPAELRARALVALHRLRHHLEGAVDDTRPILRVKHLDERSGSDDVGEQGP